MKPFQYKEHYMLIKRVNKDGFMTQAMGKWHNFLLLLHLTAYNLQATGVKIQQAKGKAIYLINEIKPIWNNSTGEGINYSTTDPMEKDDLPVRNLHQKDPEIPSYC